MNNYLKLGWRNIWRNKRRTLITIASIFFAMLFALVMRSFQFGSYDHMVNNVVQSYTGFIQVQNKDYWNDKVIDNTFSISDSLIDLVKSSYNITDVVPRLETYALASYKLQTKGVMVIGIQPSVEDHLTHLSKRIIKGNYLDDENSGLLVSERLAAYLKIDVNDSLVLIGQGYHGMSANGIYPVKGIIHLPTPDLDNKMIYMNLKSCEYLYSAPDMLTSLSLNIKDPHDLDATVAELSKKLNSNTYAVLSWKDILTDLVQQIEIDDYSGQIMLGILYMVIAFGVFGTVLMMTSERKREFAVMVAVGMQKTKLSFIVLIEMIFIGIIGTIAGMIGSLPIIIYYYLNPIRLTGEYEKMMEAYGIEPIMPMALNWEIFLNQFIIVLILILIAIIYPVGSIARINVIKSLRG
ncbi:MAG: FtsX-like permease family protein [Bacteroidales bacterium]|nr:FtsX-like permease family protein [Bacteroidales bacterium]